MARPRRKPFVGYIGPFHLHSLFGGKVHTVQGVPEDDNESHVAESNAVEAERHHQRKKEHVKALPKLE